MVGRSTTAIFLALAAAAVPPARAADPPAAETHFRQKILPFMQTYCVKCHGDRRDTAGINLELYTHLAQATEDRETWLLIQQKLYNGEMPPEGRTQPPQEDRVAVSKWIEGQLTKVDCGKPVDPGRVTLRRLNREEYNNTIRDLFALKIRPADSFPTDDSGYGFDNNGDVLGLPPLLLEKYMAAAAQVANEAIRVPVEPFKPAREFIPRLSFRGPRSIRKAPGGLMAFTENGELYVNLNVPRTGNYSLTVMGYGNSAGGKRASLLVSLEGREVGRVELRDGKRRSDAKAHKIDLGRVKHGRRRLTLTFDNDFHSPELKRRGKPYDRNAFVRLAILDGPEKAEPLPLPESHKRIFVTTPRGGADEPRAARDILRHLMRRAYRRPVRDGEVERMMKLYRLAERAGEPFEGRIKLALRAVLVSPHFLFRVELDAAEPGQDRRLSDHEFASRLSYFLWASTPDGELMRLAGRGELRKPGVLEGQVRRMLRDPKSRALTENFAGQWLQLRTLAELKMDAKTYPQWDDELRAAMIRETQLFFDHVIRNDRSLLEFLGADYTFVNDRLAQHYGMSGVRGKEFRRVRLSERRGGLVTQASVLTVTSNPTRTSPVKRGKWVLENLLGTPPPPPPPDAGELPEGDGEEAKGTLRERLVAHRRNPVCASCHQKMDPIGFALENFDGIGKFRREAHGRPIDASGELAGGVKIDGPAGLRRVLMSKADLFRRCFAEKLLTYALGRGLEFNDRCVVDALVKDLQSNRDRFSALVLGVVKSEPFQYRRAKGENR